MGQYKLLPYGISDYVQIRREGKYMVDKTMYIERMERVGNFLLHYIISSLTLLLTNTTTSPIMCSTSTAKLCIMP
ncbi:MAG: AAA family ATPase [Prevotella sp.]